MKKITFNALLNHKAHNYRPMQIEVEKVIPLYGKRFEQMRDHPLDDCHEIIENRDLMYMKGNTAHCILFLDANGSDGILVEAEGADYARKSQFIPNARAIVEANDITAGERQLHAELKAMADRIAELAHTGQKHFIFEDMLGDEDLRVLMIRTVAEMLDRREDLAEVRDHYLGIRGQADFTVTAKPAQEMKLYCPLEIQAEPQIYETDWDAPYEDLVPALIQFFRERRQVIIATSTIALQEQLYHDAQTVLKMLSVHANIILAKGMKNYACIRRVHNLYKRHKDDVYYGRLWRTVRNGQQDKAGITMNISDTDWDKICISGFGKDKCKNCPFTQTCQYNLMRSQIMRESAIIICNQNMLVSHLMNQQKGKGLFSPSANTFIIDEAHNIESKFRSAYTTSYSKSDIMHIVNDSVRNTKKQELKELAEGIAVNIEELFRMFRVQVHEQEKKSEGDATSFFLDLNSEIRTMLLILRKQFTKLDRKTGMNVGIVLQFLREATNGLNENIVWLEKEKSLRLCVCQKDIRRDISKLLFSQGRCTILTSATISDKQTGTPREKCGYYLHSIGYPIIGMVSEPKKSPFDYDNHTMLYCSDTMPYPSIEHRKQYRAASIAEIVKLLEVTNGKALILFTSKEDMEYVYKKLSNMQLPYKILMQSKTSSQAYQLDKFKADTNSVILGTGTYWEGINIEGESLSQVIIYKLPFPVPEPIIDYKMSLTENPIDEVAVPEMVIQLKQGVGRLIRSASDTGIVTILDPRVSLRKAKYADVALDALSVKNRADSIEELHTFWDRITSERSRG